MKFGLMFFAASDDSLTADRYRLVLDSSRFADAHGFSSVWVPERHFTPFGGLYPNPAVLHAALAVATRTIHLRAGSVVAPLHHPLQIAEEWAVVDNLSNGRVGVSFASGWNPDDFLWCPDRYADRHDRVFETVDAVRRLWRGESYDGVNGAGRPARVRSYPTPVQRELPVWITAAGNPKTFERAGACGAHLLTHLLDQDEQELASKIAIYRHAREAAGFDPATGNVSLMLHTFVGADADVVREAARGPYCEYIKANLGLLNGLARSRGRDVDVTSMSPSDRDAFVNFLYDRFAAERGLIGTPESCLPLVSRLEQVGVTEVACLLDFGPPVDQILANLVHLARLKDRHASTGRAAAIDGAATPRFAAADVQARCGTSIRGHEFDALLRRHGVQISGAFDRIRTIWRRDGEALADVDAGDTSGYVAHPAALDACSRALAAALPAVLLDEANGTLYVPAGMQACRVHAPMRGTVWSHATLVSGTREAGFVGNVRVYNSSGTLVVELDGLRLDPVTRAETMAVDVTPLMYERVWQASDAVIAAPDLSGEWLIAGAAPDPLAGTLRDTIARHGGSTTGSARALRGIVFVAGSRDGDAADVASRTLHDLQDVLQEHAGTPVWIVTTGAVPAAETSVPAVMPHHSTLWGLGRVLAVERPGMLGGLIDLDPEASPADSARHVVALLGDAAGDDMSAWRGGTRLLPRLRHIAAHHSSATTTPAFDGTVLITGGTGGLGLQVAAWTIARGAKHVLLLGRRTPPAAAAAAISDLAALADVSVVEADVAEYEQLVAAIGRSTTGRPPLDAVFHLAGVLDDARIGAQDWSRTAAVLKPKVTGAWNLHRFTEGLPLSHFVLFSSMASLVAVPGQGSYAAANAFLDALAHHRHERGLPALVVNWGPWGDVGHASTEYGRTAHARLDALGIGAIAPAEGLAALDLLMRRGATQAAVVDVNWPRLFDADPAAARIGLLSELADVAAATPARRAEADADTPLLVALRALPPASREPRLMQHLSALIVATLKLPPETAIQPRQRLFDLGLDSILAIEVKARLEQDLGRPLSATLLFVHPTLEALAAFLLAEAGLAAAPAPSPTVDLAALSEQELAALVLREIDGGR